MIVNCFICETDVDALYCGSHILDENDAKATRILLLFCPTCGCSILASQSVIATHPLKWGKVGRIWPRNALSSFWDVSDDVYECMEAARTSFNKGAYDTCAHICMNVISVIHRTHNAEDEKVITYSEGLALLHNQGLIGRRMYDWGQEIPCGVGFKSEDAFTKESAQSFIEFIEALCDCIYFQNKRYDIFKNRLVSTSPTKGELSL
ncbi:hypothetical protein [Paenibacillus sp. LHD-38]|uniref:hypothetical protein n=1 Tax=Paenibacillus sp. LHD-38 TaxID=3072143 RepID=UPI00280FF32D|nr:hypothetical protein [Paenibacillus sp. LHD-38]MDQ8735808.1 hypothetical protein [Paenibacillus sp. LHD-38]